MAFFPVIRLLYCGKAEYRLFDKMRIRHNVAYGVENATAAGRVSAAGDKVICLPVPIPATHEVHAMFQLVHISDLHLAPFPQPSWRQLMNKRITGYLNWTFNRRDKMEKSTFDVLVCDLKRQNPNHIAVCGDIVNLSLDTEFAQARQRIAELGPVDNVSLVFGNHDAYVPGAFAKACQVFAPWIRGNRAGTAGFFPYMCVRDTVAVIGASSAIATLPFSAAGYLGARQAQEIGMLLRQAGEKGLFRIVMIHHPPLYHAAGWNKRLWDTRRFQAAVAAYGAELVLHGHTHLPTLSFISGRHGRVPVVGVASASQDFGGHKPPAGYNLFEISNSRQRGWQCHLTRRALMDQHNNIGVFMREVVYP